MKKNNKIDNTLCSLIIIVIICGLVRLTNKFNFISYLCLLWHIKIILFAKTDEYLPIILFNHTCSSLYDNTIFTYLFNLTIFIFTLKLLFNKSRITKKTFSLIIILFCYNTILTIINSYFNVYSIFSTISLLFSYLFVVIISANCNIIDHEKCYKYFYVGFIVSALSAFSIPISRWKFNIPTAYRFKGYLRDANYYSIDALLIMNLSLIKNKGFNKVYFISLILGILSISKMFLLLSVLNIILHLLIKLFEGNKKMLLYAILSIPVIIIVIIGFSKTDYSKTIYQKYLYRSEISTLFTGRDYLQKYYLMYLKNNPVNLVFGSSINYQFLLGVGHDGTNEALIDHAAHNTYLDIILSYGLIGSLIYITFIYFVIKNINKCNYKYNDIIVDNKKQYYLFVIIILISLFSLSYLSIDFFAILVLLLIVYNPKTINIFNMNNKIGETV